MQHHIDLKRPVLQYVVRYSCGYFLVVLVAILLVWASDIFGIIKIASRAFALILPVAV
jgi:hypothetical protein